MKYYVILNKNTLTQYGITHKLWLGRLFILQRCEYDKNLILTVRKSNDLSKYDLKLNPLYIHYFSGFALTTDELDYIDYEMSMYPDNEFIQNLKRKYDAKKIRSFLKKYKKHLDIDYVGELVRRCIQSPSLVRESLVQKEFFDTLRD